MSKYVAAIRIGGCDAVVKRTIRGCTSRRKAWYKAQRLYQHYPEMVLVDVWKKRRKS